MRPGDWPMAFSLENDDGAIPFFRKKKNYVEALT